jgi:hypothetical protein
MSEPLIIGSIPKSGGEVRVQIDDYNGHSFLTIRYFYESKEGGLFPTKQGVTIPLDQIEAFKEVVNSIPDTVDPDKPEEENTDTTEEDQE